MEFQNTIKLDKNIYSKMILFRTCYTYIDKYYIFIEEDEKNWIVHLESKNENSNISDKKVKGNFLNSLINEEYRDLLIDKTKNTKEMIIARALYGADNNPSNKQDITFNEKEMDNYLEDPLDIAVPWEEKYGSEKKE